MNQTTRRVRTVATMILAVQAVAIPVGILYRWPYQFGGPGDPDRVASDFLVNGTAVSIPVVPVLILLLLFRFLVRSRNGWGTLAAVGLCILGVLVTIASLGEAFAPHTPDVPRWALVLSGVVNGGSGLALFLSAAAELRDRMRRRAPSPGPDPVAG